ncbi:hypothetical protein ORJ04_10615 [Rheinheimera baltica]|uniref:Uncharacterized protein n=1 Tax=Rheinheimera baltica TaxID=67576 RepID=A0ABT9HZ42_9GAMM|nr:hypothetical protein [Rheinheimera baltica]MDP5136400.1 hypothetical protein [Rheinheimera baltica]
MLKIVPGMLDLAAVVQLLQGYLDDMYATSPDDPNSVFMMRTLDVKCKYCSTGAATA